MTEYDAFIRRKADIKVFDGIDIDRDTTPAYLFDHQKDLVRWALAKGRAAIFADTGLGKTAMQLAWASEVSKRGRVLILAPLAVADQTREEGKRFDVDIAYRREDAGDRITITNYEMLTHFDPSEFIGVVLDESSILKSFTGSTRNAIIGAFGATPFRLACTATPAPNDFTELGNHSEFLGVKTRVEMLAEYFTHDMKTTQEWRIKGHAVKAFWTWIASWGAVVRVPSDLGYDDGAYRLPPLRMHEHVIPVDLKIAQSRGVLFPVNVTTLSDQRAERRATIDARVKKTRDLCIGDDSAIVWCELNNESEQCAATIEGAVEITGSDSVDEKVRKLAAFADGAIRVLVTKPSIAGFGLNWQHCARMVFVGASHSYEQTYQAIRRCWRFGQNRPVDVHVIRAETEQLVIDNYRRKEADAARLGAEMASMIGDSVRSEVQSASKREFNVYNPDVTMEVASWCK